LAQPAEEGGDYYNYSGLQDKDATSSSVAGAGAGAGASAAAAKAPCLVFGFNGWDGSERPFVTPLFPGDEEGTWAASVHLPNYARVLDLAVSDGDLAFDTNGGEYFHLRLAHIQVLGADGVTINTYRQAGDGSLTPTGVLALNDPQELERMIEEELEMRRRDGEGSDGGDPALESLPLLGEMEMETEMEEVEGLLLDTNTNDPTAVMSAALEASESVEGEFGGGEAARQLAASGATGVALSPQAAERAGSLQQLRAEAGVIGERLGLSSIAVNDVREAFEDALGLPAAVAYEGPDAALLGAAQAGQALARLGLEGFGAEEVEGLCVRVLGAKAGEGGEGAGLVSLEGLMRLFKELDEEDCGISIV
jgi:hypothetical protein